MKKFHTLFLCISTLSMAQDVLPQGILPGGCYQQKASTTYTPSPIVAAIKKAAEYTLTPTDQIMPTNDTQTVFLAHYLNSIDVLSALSPEEMRTWASTDFDELNNILKTEGFDIRLVKTRPNDIGIVAILKTAIKWKQKTATTNITHEQTAYDAIVLEAAKQGCTIAQPTNHAHPIASVETKSGDTIHFTIADEQAHGFTLRDKIEMLRKAATTPTNFSSVIVPMININETQTLEWLIGLTFGNMRVSKAEQQTKFKMNETGAKVESAATLTLTRCCTPTNIYTIDQPFFVWIERPSMEEPYFAAYVTPEDWHN